MGFTRCISDNQLFVLRKDSQLVYLLKHVDDLMLAAPKGSNLLSFVETELSKSYKLTTSLNPENFVGLAIFRDRKNHKITLTQPSYVAKLDERFQTKNTSPTYPMSEDFLTSSIDHADDPKLDLPDQVLFQEKFGSVLYLASQTRSDLLYAVGQLSRRSNKCTARDMKAADRLLDYIRQTPGLGLTLGSSSGSLDIHAFVDASYNCYADSKSHTGVAIKLGDDSGAFFTMSKKQSITADSTTVAEFIGTHSCCQKILWAQNLLAELGYHPQIYLHQDNTSTIQLLKHQGNSGRTKHIALRYNMIRETIRINKIKVVYTPTELMVADILTKPLGMRLFNIHQKFVLGIS